MEAGFTDSQISLRTGHNHVQSIQPYAKILGQAGKSLQASLLAPANAEKNVLPKDAGSGSVSEESAEEETEMSLRELVGSINNNSGNVTFNAIIYM